MKQKNKGFTLIELLVVISIIALLASIILVGLNNARAKSRDAKRKADIAQVRKALELYYNTNNSYPSSTTAVTFTDATLNTAMTPFLSALPKDPQCASGAIACNYQYITDAANTSYGIYIPFANDGGTSCKLRYGNASLGTWFSSAPDCTYFQ